MEVEGSLMSCSNQQQHQQDDSFVNAESATWMAGTPLSENKPEFMNMRHGTPLQLMMSPSSAIAITPSPGPPPALALGTPMAFSPCPICCSPMVPPDQLQGLSGQPCSPSPRELYTIECGHRFHLQCVGRWVASKEDADCPNCRAAIHAQRNESLRDFCPVGGHSTNRDMDSRAMSTQEVQQLIVRRTSSARNAVMAAMQQRATQQTQHPQPAAV